MKKLLILIIVILMLTFCTEKKPDPAKENEVESVQENIIREGEIDLAALDTNKDGKLWECPMDWNVIDDKAGKCTVCGMKLKEYTLDETEMNLIQHGHKVKSEGTDEGNDVQQDE